MGTKHITNDGAEIIYVGGKMIPPGEGRDIEEALLPPEHRDAPVQEADKQPSLDELLAELLHKPVKELIDGLSGMTQEALERMETLEGESKKSRKTLLEAIAAEKMARADEAMQNESLAEDLKKPTDELIAGLGALEVDDLARMASLEGAAEQPRTELLDAIAAEQAKRNEA